MRAVEKSVVALPQVGDSDASRERRGPGLERELLPNPQRMVGRIRVHFDARPTEPHHTPRSHPENPVIRDVSAGSFRIRIRAGCNGRQAFIPSPARAAGKVHAVANGRVSPPKVDQPITASSIRDLGHAGSGFHVDNDGEVVRPERGRHDLRALRLEVDP